jgi:hypothetical protein
MLSNDLLALHNNCNNYSWVHGSGPYCTMRWLRMHMAISRVKVAADARGYFQGEGG